MYLLADLYEGLPWRWIWLAGWAATCLLTIAPLRGRRLDQDDVLRFLLLTVLWVPFLAVVFLEVRKSVAGSASPPAAPESQQREG